MTHGIVFNTSKVRLGKLQLTILGFMRMNEHKLSTDLLGDTFRYGKEVEQGKIVCKYDEFSVGMHYALDETRLFRGDLASNKYHIITCWKQKNRKEVR